MTVLGSSQLDRLHAVIRTALWATFVTGCSLAWLLGMATQASADGGVVTRLDAPDDTTARFWSASGRYHLRVSGDTYTVIDSGPHTPTGTVIPFHSRPAIANDGTVAYVSGPLSGPAAFEIYVAPASTHASVLLAQYQSREFGPGVNAETTVGDPRLAASGNLLVYLVSRTDFITSITTATLHVYNIATQQDKAAAEWSSDTDWPAKIPFPNYIYSLNASGTTVLMGYRLHVAMPSFHGIGLAPLAAPRSPQIVSTPGDAALGARTSFGAISADGETLVVEQESQQTGATLALNVYRVGSGLSPFPQVDGKQCSPPGIFLNRAASSTMSANGRFALCVVFVPASGASSSTRLLNLVDLADNTATLVDSQGAVPEWVADDGSSVIFQRQANGDQGIQYRWSRDGSGLSVVPPTPVDLVPGVTTAPFCPGCLILSPYVPPGTCDPGLDTGWLNIAGTTFVCIATADVWDDPDLILAKKKCVISMGGTIVPLGKTIKILLKSSKSYKRATKLQRDLDAAVADLKKVDYPGKSPSDIKALNEGISALNVIRDPSSFVIQLVSNKRMMAGIASKLSRGNPIAVALAVRITTIADVYGTIIADITGLRTVADCVRAFSAK